MDGSTYYVSEVRGQFLFVLPVRVVASWSEFVMVEGSYPSGEDYLAVVKRDRLSRSAGGEERNPA
jgi:hypothetical protein